MIAFNDICNWPNLLAAAHKAQIGKRSGAVVAHFNYFQEEQILTLLSELQGGEYQPGRYHSFYIHDPKRRLISAAPFRDRVVHHALCNLFEPVVERSFVCESFANRRGKGTHRAIDHLQRLARRFRFALSCDLRQFFPSIDHDILRTILFRKISDPRTRRLVNSIIDSGIGVLSEEYKMVWFPGDDLLSAGRPRGLPIGNLTSQIWANCYLNPFDHFVKRELRCRAYARYVDDFVLFADDKETLWNWNEAIDTRLRQQRLVVHLGTHPRPVTEGIPFLGFIVFPGHRRLKSRNATHFSRRLRSRLTQLHAGEIDQNDLATSVRSWIAHASHGNTVGLQRSVLARHGLSRDEFL